MATAAPFLQFVAGQVSGTAARRIDWVADTIEVSLHTSAWTPDQANHDFFNDTTNEVSGGGYARQTLGTKSVNVDTSLKHIQLRAANSTFTSLTATFRYIVVSKNTGSSATSPLIGYVDTLGQSVSATNYIVDWDDSEGVVSFAVP